MALEHELPALPVAQPAPSPKLSAIAASVAVVATLATTLLVVLSLLDFTTTGPTIQQEILKQYFGYAIYGMARLAAYTELITLLCCGLGAIVYACLCLLRNRPLHLWWVLVWSASGLLVVTALQFCRQLLYIPGSIAASFPFDIARTYPLWETLSPQRLLIGEILLVGAIAVVTLASAWRLSRQGRYGWLSGLLGVWFGVAGVILWAYWAPEPAPVLAGTVANPALPNILMIGSDTLRGDRIGLNGYPRNLTPFIDKLASQGTFFANTFVPLARTAPSLTSMLTGTWPHTHGIRENYISDAQTKLPVVGLPTLLTQLGYHTVALGDWAASDLGKLSLGFQEADTSPDQWNLKYLIRQGPKEIRLFLTLFTHNRFGHRFLPELYYLAGVPLTSQMTRAAELKLNDLATQKQPFLLDIFIASTHAPFGSEYPYYTLFSKHDYRGPSKFVIDGLKDPSAIIKRQEEDASFFDVQQIIDIYDGAVRQFDDAVSRIVAHLRAQGLDRNTIIVIYSDHGTDLFERQTWGQGNSVIGRDPSARIPLLIIDPRRSGGKIVKHVVRSVDIAPTLLSLLKQPIPSDMEGVSLIPYMNDPDTDLHLSAFHETGVWLGNIPGLSKNHLRYPSVLEMLEVPDIATGTLAIKPEFAQRIIQAKDRMIRTDRWKLVYLPMQDDAVYWLYDVVSDPDCNNNVFDRYPKEAAILKQQLITWMTGDKAFSWNGHYLIPKN